jgi:hypothetical protein
MLWCLFEPSLDENVALPLVQIHKNKETDFFERGDKNDRNNGFDCAFSGICCRV